MKDDTNIRKQLLIAAGKYGLDREVVQRIDALIKSIDDGVVAESSAVKHIEFLVKDLEKRDKRLAELAKRDAEYVDGNKYPSAIPKLSAKEAKRRRQILESRDHYAIGDEYGCIPDSRGRGEGLNSSAGLFNTPWSKIR